VFLPYLSSSVFFASESSIFVLRFPISFVFPFLSIRFSYYVSLFPLSLRRSLMSVPCLLLCHCLFLIQWSLPFPMPMTQLTCPLLSRSQLLFNCLVLFTWPFVSSTIQCTGHRSFPLFLFAIQSAYAFPKPHFPSPSQCQCPVFSYSHFMSIPCPFLPLPYAMPLPMQWQAFPFHSSAIAKCPSIPSQGKAHSHSIFQALSKSLSLPGLLIPIPSQGKPFLPAASAFLAAMHAMPASSFACYASLQHPSSHCIMQQEPCLHAGLQPACSYACFSSNLPCSNASSAGASSSASASSALSSAGASSLASASSACFFSRSFFFSFSLFSRSLLLWLQPLQLSLQQELLL